MLDLNRQFILPEFPQALLYRDHENAAVYYLIPWAPALETDDDGRPEARLIVHLERKDDRKVPSGGQLSLTTILRVSPLESVRIKRALEARLAQNRTPSQAGPPAIQLLAPEWSSGTANVCLTSSWTLAGQPSLFAENRCAFTTRLNAGEAQTLLDLWGRELPDARIVYHMAMRVAAAAEGALRASDSVHSETDHASLQRLQEIAVGVRTLGAITQPVNLEGPLWCKGLESLVSRIDLSP